MKYLSILIFYILFTGCKQGKIPEVKKTKKSPAIESRVSLSEEQLKTISIKSVSLEKKKMAGILHLNGKVDVNPDHRVSLSSALGGHVKSIDALPGKRVKKGDVILVLEDNQFIQIQQEYLTTKAQLISAEANYVRQNELNVSKSASDKSMQLAETEYYSLLAVKKALEEKLRLININPSSLAPDNIRRNIQLIAPFNGVVSYVMVNKGKYVLPSDVLVELINPEGLLLNIKVFEKNWSEVAAGQVIEAYTNQEADKRIQARIITTGSAINDDGSMEIIARVINTNSVKLVAGLYVNALLKLENAEAYVLPEEAVVSFEGKSYVFEDMDNNTFQLIEVINGKVQEGVIEIINHKAMQGKKIVGKGAYALLMALKNTSEE